MHLPFVCSVLTTLLVGTTMHHVAQAAPATTPIKIGFPRYPERDTADWLAGMHVAISEANTLGLAPGYSFELVLDNIPDCTSADWGTCIAEATTTGAAFLAKVPTMTAVMTPDWWIADHVVAAAAPLQIPVISPKTFGHQDTTHVVNLNQPFSSDIPHFIGYMLGAHDCARTGIILTHYLITMDPLYAMQRAFAYGGYDTPPYIFTNATDAAMRDFVLGQDPDRLCFLMQVTVDELFSIQYYAGPKG